MCWKHCWPDFLSFVAGRIPNGYSVTLQSIPGEHSSGYQALWLFQSRRPKEDCLVRDNLFSPCGDRAGLAGAWVLLLCSGIHSQKQSSDLQEHLLYFTRRFMKRFMVFVSGNGIVQIDLAIYSLPPGLALIIHIYPTTLPLLVCLLLFLYQNTDDFWKGKI